MAEASQVCSGTPSDPVVEVPEPHEAPSQQVGTENSAPLTAETSVPCDAVDSESKVDLGSTELGNPALLMTEPGEDLTCTPSNLVLEVSETRSDVRCSPLAAETSMPCDAVDTESKVDLGGTELGNPALLMTEPGEDLTCTSNLVLEVSETRSDVRCSPLVAETSVPCDTVDTESKVDLGGTELGNPALLMTEPGEDLTCTSNPVLEVSETRYDVRCFDPQQPVEMDIGSDPVPMQPNAGDAPVARLSTEVPRFEKHDFNSEIVPSYQHLPCAGESHVETIAARSGPADFPATSFASLESGISRRLLPHPRGAQERAEWSASHVKYLQEIPHQGETTRISTQNMDSVLPSKIMANQPIRRNIGFTEEVVRDVVQAVVKEIVGILDCVVDRVLVEQKNGMLRKIVGELILDDTRLTVASAMNSFREEEFGHLRRELSRLNQEFEQQLADVQRDLGEIRAHIQSQKTSHSTLASEVRGIEVRLGRCESDLLPRSENTLLLESAQKERAMLSEQVEECKCLIGERDRSLAELRDYCQDTFAGKESVAEAERGAHQGFTDVLEWCKVELAHLQNNTVARCIFDPFKLSHGQHVESIDQDMANLRTDVETYNSEVRQVVAAIQLHYARKTEVTKDIANGDKERRVRETIIAEKILELEATAARSDSVERFHRSLQDAQTKLGGYLESIEEEVKDTQRVLRDFKTHCQTNLATQSFARDVADECARKMAIECDEKEQLAAVAKDLQEEKERSRHNFTKFQQSRKDMSDAMQVVHGLQKHVGKVESQIFQVAELVANVDKREEIHWKNLQGGIAQATAGCENLQCHFQHLKDDLTGSINDCKSNGEQLWNFCSNAVLEQMSTGTDPGGVPTSVPPGISRPLRPQNANGRPQSAKQRAPPPSTVQPVGCARQPIPERLPMLEGSP